MPNKKSCAIESIGLQIAVIAALTAACYSFMVNTGFKTMDDEFSIVANERIKSLTNVPEIMTSSYFGSGSYYRPLVLISYMIEYHFIGLDAFYYYLTNIFIHSMTSVFVLLLMRLFFEKKKTAFFVALLFAIHPVHWEAVSNISGRAILLCGLFTVIAFYLFCLSRKNGNPAALAASVGSYALALLCKESAGVLPAGLAAWLFFTGRKKEEGAVRWLAPLLPYAAVAAGYVVLRRVLGLANLFYWHSPEEILLGGLTFLRSVLTHLRILCLPLDLYFDRSQKLFLSLADPGAGVTVAAFAALAVALIVFRKKTPALAAFFIAWFFIDLLPVSQLFVTIGTNPGYISAADHFLYVPSIPFLGLAVLAAERFSSSAAEHRWISPVIMKTLAAAGVILFFCLNVTQNIYSSNEMTMLRRSVALNPNNTRIRDSLGFTYAKAGRPDLAEEQFRLSLAVEPFNARARISLGKALVDQGKIWEGLEVYEQIADPHPYENLLKNNIKVTYEALARVYQKKLEKDSGSARARYSLGVVRAKQGNYEEAAKDFEQSLRIDPGNANALFNLASVYQALGRGEDAKEMLRKFLETAGPMDKMRGEAEEKMRHWK